MEFTGDSLQAAFESMKVKTDDLMINNFTVYVTPLNDGCDGFFIARMKRIKV
jgi:uncharacterized protein YfdQ (DUF2303 family)